MIGTTPVKHQATDETLHTHRPTTRSRKCVAI